VAIADGVIREIGPKLQGKRELDASGCAVAPGFIDIHTHYDAQVFWDPDLQPSCFHGVTTVVAGNCGFTIAPTRPEHHDVIVRTLENVEDMDPATLTEGIVWDFETFPQYLDLVRRRGTLLNFTSYIGHSALRLYVMGDAAYERAATAEEIDRMCRLVGEALAAGAAGFSTSFSFAHRGIDGKPVPSRFAERDEVEALFAAAGKAGKGVVLATPGEQCSYPDFYDVAARIGRPFTWPLFAAPGNLHRTQLKIHEEATARGANVWPQVTPRPLTMQFTLADAYNLNVGTVFGELLKVSREVRLAAYRDPAWRAHAAADLNKVPMRPRWETFEVSESQRFPELQGRRVTDLAKERNVSPFDVMCEIALAEDLATRFRAYIANDDVDAVADLLTHDNVILGLSDAGAHVDQLCDAGYATYLLGKWVREREALALPAAVRRLTSEVADFFGIRDRGRIAPGQAADLVLLDPDTVDDVEPEYVRDLPGGAKRLISRALGIHATLVAGQVVWRDGQHTGAWPGAVLRSSPGRT
jgi:N-acyl-D-aspartate/D-glutamate deacylase